MDAYEATRVVFSRIQSLDPEHASKIMGLLLIQDHGEKEMIRLAFGPESLLQSLILKARKDLGLLPPSPPSPSPFLRQNSWAQSQPFSRTANNGGLDELQQTDELYGELGDEFQNPMFYPDEQMMFQNSLGAWGGPGGLGWKPCLYFARGYCKNGAGCRFVHDDKLDAAAAAAAAAVEQEFLLRSKSPRPSQLMASAFPYSPTGASKSLNLFLQQQNENQRAAAVAAALMAGGGGGEDVHKFMVRSPRLERSDLAAGINNPGARQIYLTFPADSTFSEEDVSNYFSIYGPVQDVRIPYQQKRMFGFVTFVYPETVKLILAKGNPHFVCDARVLVKPYKEKGKVPEKYRNKQLQADRGDFSGCSTPTGLLDTRDPFELPHLGSRMLYGTSPTQEAILRRKLEEQQQAAELQQAIELQGRRFMGLQLLDLKSRTQQQQLNSLNSAINTAPSVSVCVSDGKSSSACTNSEEPMLSNQDNKANSGTAAGRTVVASVAATAEAAAWDPQKVNISSHEEPVNATVDKAESAAVPAPNVDCDFQESGPEHNLPDSPFASPTKAYSQIADAPFLAIESSYSNNTNNNINNNVNNNNNINNSINNNSSSSLVMPSPRLPPSALDIPSYNSCFFQIPRFSSGHGAIGM